ncbi:MAG: 50S ribosomal protein L30 [Deltaproteobacteria bacterium]|nr:50S ribosomal protein L30 [Deltaproteobacteria bacterium]
MAKKWIQVTQVRSEISTPRKTHRETLRALGLTRRGKSVVVEDTPTNRGQIRAVCHLVKAVECSGPLGR